MNGEVRISAWVISAWSERLKASTSSGLECSVSNSLQRCFPDNDPKAKVFTPDIQLTYDDYRKYNFSKDAELLYLIDMDM